MSTTDAFVIVMCDDCQEEEQAELPFVYFGPMHTQGMYDHNKPRLPSGWIKTGEDEHYCEDCAEKREARA